MKPSTSRNKPDDGTATGNAKRGTGTTEGKNASVPVGK